MSLVSCFCTTLKATWDRERIVKYVHIINFLAFIVFICSQNVLFLLIICLLIRWIFLVLLIDMLEFDIHCIFSSHISMYTSYYIVLVL